MKIEPTTMLKLLVVASFYAYTQAQIPFLGDCPNITLQEDFSLPKYMGKWYELKRYFTTFQGLQSCVTADYTLEPNNTVLVVNSGLNAFAKKYSVARGDAIMPDPNEPAKLKVKIGAAPARGDYWVVSTDYTSYSIVWSCVNVPFVPASFQLAFVLTREPVLEQEKVDEIDAILKEKNIARKLFLNTRQTNCPGRGPSQQYDQNALIFDMEH